MTSGTFNHVLISSITVERGERQRRELHKIEELADSIRRIGLIHPPVVTREHVLVAGERRFAAVSHLGWERIPVQYTDELSLQELRAIELEENIKRVDITWQEQVDAVKTYHNFQQSVDPSWSAPNTAEALGYTPEYVNRYLMVAKAIESNPSISAAPKVSTAIGIVQRANERRNDKELASIRGASEAVVEAPPRSIINESFLDWAPSYDGPKFNFIHCDFPYGINADSFQQGGAVAHGGYEDSPDTYWTLCKSLASNLNRIASESCHLVFWYSMKYHCETINFLREETDFVVNPYPLVWHKTDNVGTLPDPSRGPRQCYEVALFAHRGDRKIVRAKSNIYGAPTVRDKHMSEKPEPMLRHFFEMLVDTNTILLDPTAGSGSALRAADSLGAAHVLGLELNEDFADRAQDAFVKARKLRSAA